MDEPRFQMHSPVKLDVLILEALILDNTKRLPFTFGEISGYWGDHPVFIPRDFPMIELQKQIRSAVQPSILKGMRKFVEMVPRSGS